MNKNQSFKTPDPLGDKSFQLAIKIINIHKHLHKQNKELEISQKLFQAGTNPGAKIREARSAKSDADFIYKLGKAQISCQETIYWLELLYKTKSVEKEVYEEVNSLTIEVIKMLISSIKTKKRNIKY